MFVIAHAQVLWEASIFIVARVVPRFNEIIDWVAGDQPITVKGKESPRLVLHVRHGYASLYERV
jgi:hypothetical protein